MKCADIKWDLLVEDPHVAIFESDDMSAKVLLSGTWPDKNQYTVLLRTMSGVYINMADVIVGSEDIKKYSSISRTEIAVKKACEVFDEDAVPPPT